MFISNIKEIIEHVGSRVEVAEEIESAHIEKQKEEKCQNVPIKGAKNIP